jgi:hypothetical protein
MMAKVFKRKTRDRKASIPFFCFCCFFIASVSSTLTGIVSGEEAAEQQPKAQPKTDDASKKTQPSCPVSVYIGASTRGCFISHYVSGVSHYWTHMIGQAYKQDLQTRYELERAKEKLVNILFGFPSDYFDALLFQTPSKISSDWLYFPRFSFSLGAFIFRQGDVLIALECSVGKSSYSWRKKNEIILFHGDVPEELAQALGNTKDGVEASLFSSAGYMKYKYNALASQITQNIFFGGDITLQQNMEIKEGYCTDIALLFGSIVRNRLFVFATLGLEINREKINIQDVKIETGEIKIFINRNVGSYESSAKWIRWPVVPSYDLFKYPLNISQNKNIYGMALGVGTDFFISRKLFARVKVGFAYYPEAKFLTIDNVNIAIKHAQKNIQCSAGIFWRFT